MTGISLTYSGTPGTGRPRSRCAPARWTGRSWPTLPLTESTGGDLRLRDDVRTDRRVAPPTRGSAALLRLRRVRHGRPRRAPLRGPGCRRPAARLRFCAGTGRRLPATPCSTTARTSIDWRQAGPGRFVAPRLRPRLRRWDRDALVRRPLLHRLLPGPAVQDSPTTPTTPASSSGSPIPGPIPWVAINQGHEIQIKEGAADDEPQKTGLDLRLRPRRPAQRATDRSSGTTCSIDVVGQTYTVILNGLVVNTFTSDGSRGADWLPRPPEPHRRGPCVWFRNIQVRELTQETAGPTPTPEPTTEPTIVPPTDPPERFSPCPRRTRRSVVGRPDSYAAPRPASPSARSQVATFECRLDTAPWSACAADAAFSGLRPGRHTFWARAVGTAGPDGSPAGRTWTVDRRAPRIRVLDGLDPTRDPTPRLRASVVDRAAGFRRADVRLSVDGRRVGALRWRKGHTLTVRLPRLTPGTHRVRLVVRDRAGNVRRLARTLTILR